MLIIVSGLPGTGKTTFARALAAQLEVRHLNSDMIRDELGRRGQYDPETKALIYREMFDRTAALIAKGETVIVDATFHKKEYRQPYLDLADQQPAVLRWIELQTREDVVRERVTQKRKYSEADFPVYQKIRDRYEPLEIPHLVLSTEALPLEQMLERAGPYLKEEKL